MARGRDKISQLQNVEHYKKGYFLSGLWKNLYKKWVEHSAEPIWELLPEKYRETELTDSSWEPDTSYRLWYNNRYWPVTLSATLKVHELNCANNNSMLITGKQLEEHDPKVLTTHLENLFALLTEHDHCASYLSGALRFPMDADVAVEVMGRELFERFQERVGPLLVPTERLHPATVENLRTYIKAQRGDCIDKLEERILLNLLI